jgi:hypothetical protein
MGWRDFWGKALTERTYVIAAAATIVGAIAIGLTVWAVSGSGEDVATDPSAETAGVSTERDDSESGADGAVDSDEDSDEESDGESAEDSSESGGRSGADIDVLVAADADDAVDDEMAVTMYCTIDADRIAAMPLSADGDVSEEALRAAVISLSEQHDEWRFAAYGRPGFEQILEPVAEIETGWQQAVDAYDAADSGAARSAVNDADAAVAALRDRLDEADVECA